MAHEQGEHTSVRRPKSPTAHLSDYPLIRLSRPIGPTAHCSDQSNPCIPTRAKSDHSDFRLWTGLALGQFGKARGKGDSQSRFMCLPLSFLFVTGFTVCVILWSIGKCPCCSALLMPLSRALSPSATKQNFPSLPATSNFDTFLFLGDFFVCILVVLLQQG